MGPAAIFPLLGVLIDDCVCEIAVYGPHSYFSFIGCPMDHCVGEIAVYGPHSYFSFMGCPNAPLWAGRLQGILS
jgi:hypothetical protein